MLEEITKAVEFLTEHGVELMLREDEPTLAYVPIMVFLEMFSEYEKGLVSDSQFDDMYILKAVHNGVEYRAYAYEHELKGA